MDPDQVLPVVRPGLATYCLQRLSRDEKMAGLLGEELKSFIT